MYLRWAKNKDDAAEISLCPQHKESGDTSLCHVGRDQCRPANLTLARGHHAQLTCATHEPRAGADWRVSVLRSQWAASKGLYIMMYVITVPCWREQCPWLVVSVSLNERVTSLELSDVRILVSVSALYLPPDIGDPPLSWPDFLCFCNLYLVWRKISSWRPTPQTFCPLGAHPLPSLLPPVRKWKLRNPHYPAAALTQW